MKLKLAMALCILCFHPTTHAKEFIVAKRKIKTHGMIYVKVDLPHLTSDHAFEGKYFKIVSGKENDPISFSADQRTQLKAATVYYHLNRARDYWLKNFAHHKAMNQKQMTVRLDLTNVYDEFGHFAHDNRNPQFNNALSIPEGQTPHWVPEDKQEQWGDEIWFRPKKKILTEELGDLGKNPLEVASETLQGPIIQYSMTRFQNDLLMRAFYPGFSTNNIWVDVIRFAGTYAVTKAIVIGSRYADPLFLDKYYYLESAIIPEIIYHEYAHIMLSDHLEMSHSTPVNEGLADYFAARLSGKNKVYAPVKGESNISAKKTRQKNMYRLIDEDLRRANADFTLSVLWDVTEILGEELGDKVVYKSREYLSTADSSISDGLLRSLIKACDEVCPSPFKNKLMLYEGFRYRGF